MLESYCQLLDGLIYHLKRLKERGERYVTVSPATLGELSLALAAAARPKAPQATAKPSPVRMAKPPSPMAATSSPVTQPVPMKSAPTTQTPSTASAAVASGIQPPPMPVTPASETKPAVDLGNHQTPEEVMAALRTKALACVKCPHLAQARTQVVFGVGDVHASLMFVGEAPGADEDLQGEPFVGKAGQLLTKIIETMGFSRDTVYIANILKCRPDTPGQTAGNRKPTPAEMQTCLPYLLAQIKAIQPKVLVALGATAVEGLLGKSVGITKLRGHFQMFQGVPIMPTYHPAYLLRNQSLATKREVWEDMLQVLEKLGCPISAKQRNYFLRK